MATRSGWAVQPVTIRMAPPKTRGWSRLGWAHAEHQSWNRGPEWHRLLAVPATPPLLPGRNPSSITPGLQVPFVIAPTAAEAREALHAPFTRFIAVATQSAETWHAAGHEHPSGPSYGGVVDLLPEEMAANLEIAMNEVPHEVLSRACVWGTVDQVVESI